MIFNYFAGDTTGYPDLSQGAANAYVSELQARLNATGAHTEGDDPGVFEGNTKQAVMNFQLAYGLPANGSVDAATWSQLIDATPQIVASGKTGKANPAMPTSSTTSDDGSTSVPLGLIIAGIGGAAVLTAFAFLRPGRRVRHAHAGYGRRRR